MSYLITGAGQIGTALARLLSSSGADITIIRRRNDPVPGVRTLTGDAGDRTLLANAARGTAAIFHCIHAPYDAQAWRTELPERERAAMDIAAELEIPIIFPESVYAYGHNAENLTEGAPLDPCSPLGDVRADLLTARAAHPARTRSIIASDLVGSGASVNASVPLLTIAAPVLNRRTAWTFGDTDAPHSLTDLTDLAAAMLSAANDPDPSPDRILHAPTSPALSMWEFAAEVAASTQAMPRVRTVPTMAVRATGLVNRTARALGQQAYLWERPCILRPGALMTAGAMPRPWEEIIAGSISTVRASQRATAPARRTPRRPASHR